MGLKVRGIYKLNIKIFNFKYSYLFRLYILITKKPCA